MKRVYVILRKTTSSFLINSFKITENFSEMGTTLVPKITETIYKFTFIRTSMCLKCLTLRQSKNVRQTLLNYSVSFFFDA